MKESSCHDPKMDAYCKAVRRLEEKFDGLELNHVLRKYNETTDALAKMASERATVRPDVFVSDLYKLSVDYKDDGGSDQPPGGSGLDPEVSVAHEPEAIDIEPEPPAPDDLPDWCYPLLQRLVDGSLPSDQAEARRVARRAKTFLLLDGEMYKRSLSSILMRCITHQEGIKLLEDIHSGACGHHAAPRTLVGNAFRQGFYWPTAVADATQIMRTCEDASSMLGRFIFPLRLCRRSPSHGPLLSRASTSSGLYKRRPGASPTCLLQLTSSPSGLRSDPSEGSRPNKQCCFLHILSIDLECPTP